MRRLTATWIVCAAVLATTVALVTRGVSAPHSTDSRVKFSVGGIQYSVPRNYISGINDWRGGPQNLVTFQATFPHFEPFTAKTRGCMTAPPAYRLPGCFPIEFWIRPGGSDPTDDERFNSARKLFLSQVPLPGPDGFELYETGPLDARVNTYLKRTPEHTLMIVCFVHGDLARATCDSSSRLESGDVLTYRLDGAQLGSASQIDTGLRQIIRSFTAATG